MTTDSDKLKIALVQMSSGIEMDANIECATDHIRQAAANGARYIQTPENTNLLDYKRARQFDILKPEANTAAVSHFSQLAKELGIWLHIGGMGIRLSDTQLANRAFVFSPEGQKIATYDKIHMFDVTLPSGQRFRESSAYQAGNTAPVVSTPWGGIGVTICYDLRFAYLYRALAQAGATVLTCPAAFTKETGDAHWSTLLRTRAIETGSFVIAAAQCGSHESGRETYGHSIVIDPWGKVLAEAGDTPGLLEAELDLSQIKTVRGRIPTLTHDREVSVSVVGQPGTVSEPA